MCHKGMPQRQTCALWWKHALIWHHMLSYRARVYHHCLGASSLEQDVSWLAKIMLVPAVLCQNFCNMFLLMIWVMQSISFTVILKLLSHYSTAEKLWWSYYTFKPVGVDLFKHNWKAEKMSVLFHQISKNRYTLFLYNGSKRNYYRVCNHVQIVCAAKHYIELCFYVKKAKINIFVIF